MIEEFMDHKKESLAIGLSKIEKILKEIGAKDTGEEIPAFFIKDKNQKKLFSDKEFNKMKSIEEKKDKRKKDNPEESVEAELEALIESIFGG